LSWIIGYQPQRGQGNGEIFINLTPHHQIVLLPIPTRPIEVKPLFTLFSVGKEISSPLGGWGKESARGIASVGGMGGKKTKVKIGEEEYG
jgi:hypothetical protein